MVNHSNKLSLRVSGGCFALAFACLFSLPASALASSFSGTFEDFGGDDELVGDKFRIINDAASTEDILTVVYDLSTSVTGTTFEPATWPFAPILSTLQILALREQYSLPHRSR